MIGCSCYSWHVLLSFGVFFIVSQIENWYEMVMAKGGRVVFVDDGTLTKYQRIALILRF